LADDDDVVARIALDLHPGQASPGATAPGLIHGDDRLGPGGRRRPEHASAVARDLLGGRLLAQRLLAQIGAVKAHEIEGREKPMNAIAPQSCDATKQ
jgi:hypothetical protein